jgi:hypothetical protein
VTRLELPIIIWDFVYTLGRHRPFDPDLFPVDPKRKRLLLSQRFSVFKKSLVGIERRARNPASSGFLFAFHQPQKAWAK